MAKAPRGDGRQDSIELRQYNDSYPYLGESAAQAKAHKDVYPKPMYMANDVGHQYYREMGYPLRTKRTKCMVDVQDISGDRGRGGY